MNRICHNDTRSKDEKKMSPSMTDKSAQTRHDKQQDQQQQQWRHASGGRRPSSRQSSISADSASRTARQALQVCTKHEKEKAKMQAAIEKLQEAFCDKETKLQDTKSQLVRERRMSEIMERQLKNARNLSEQLGRIIYDRETEIRTLKNLLNKRADAKSLAETQLKRRRSKDDFHGAAMRRSSSTSDHTDCPSLSSSSVDKMLKEVHSLIDGLKIKDEAIKGLQEECTRRLDKIQVLQRSVQVLQDQLTQSSQHHGDVCVEKDNLITQLQHSLKESESTVQSLLSEKTQVVMEGESTIQELQELLRQQELKVKRVQEKLDTKETELRQLRDALDSRQRDLDAKQRDLEEANEELFRSQMEGESLKMELNQEKCSLNKMSEEINSLVDKLTTAVEEMEATKMEYQKKDERLKHTQVKIQELYIMFLSDQDIMEKLQEVYKTRREFTGRRVLSEEDVIEKVLHPRTKRHYFRNENKGKYGVSNQQIHKQQLAELQQQVNDSQAVCSILQEQLKEVTDFLDQLLHIDISPKNLPALSLIKHYGKHLKNPAHDMSKERVAPDGVSSNSQLDMEFSRQGTLDEDQTTQPNTNSLSLPSYGMEAHHGSYEEISYYEQPRPYYNYNHRSVSAENILESTTHSISVTDMGVSNKDASEVVPVSVSIQGASSDSDEIILLLNDRESSEAPAVVRGRKKLSRPASPPFPRGLKITENYGSDGSINTRENSGNVIERSVSFGSFSDSVLMSYEQSERDESSGMVNNRNVRSIDMMDLIPVGAEAAATKGGVFLSSDSDIWSEPDTTLSRQRMGLRVEPTSQSSDYSTTCVSGEEQQQPPQQHKQRSRCESRRSRTSVLHVPTKKTANKVKRWLERLKNYLRMFEEANFHLNDEINNLCDVRSQMTAVMNAEEKIDNSEAILFDLAEYIRLNFLMQKKLEKSIHFNRQLIDVFQRNISCQKKPVPETTTTTTTLPKAAPIRHPPKQHKRPLLQKGASYPPVGDATNPDLHSQLLNYHSTLTSCQDMIKDLHSQLKDRELAMSRHELHGYLEDIDHCIGDLCHEMEPRDRRLQELEEQLGTTKRSLYELRMENLELKECLELSESKQLEMEDSSGQMLRELQLTMQRLADLEDRFRVDQDDDQQQKEDEDKYPQYGGFRNGGGDTANYARDWESEDY